MNCNGINGKEIAMAFTFNFGGFNPDWFNPANFNGNQEGEAEGSQQSYQNPFAQRPQKERKPRKAIGNAFTRTLINLGVTILFALVYFAGLSAALVVFLNKNLLSGLKEDE